VPNWQPNWADVDFDHAKAAVAAGACRTTAATIDNVLLGLGNLPAVDHWTGRYKDDFMNEQSGMVADLLSTMADLRRLASQIERASTEAETEQAKRVADRMRWREERDREDQANDRCRLPNGHPVPC
jgi:hypothetical protein